MKQTSYVDGNYKIIDYENGSSIRVFDEVGSLPVTPNPQPTLEELQAQVLMNTEMLLIYSELGM